MQSGEERGDNIFSILKMESIIVIQPDLKSIKPAKKEALDLQRAIEFEDCMEADFKTEMLSKCTSMLDTVFYIDGVLTISECSDLCATCDNCGHLKFWSSAGRDDEAARSFRDADTVEVKSKILSDTIWERMKTLLPNPRISIPDDEDDINWERDLVGNWEASSLNFDLLFAKYPNGGAFAPHTDGRAIHSFNTRSFSTVIIFLNDISAENGGGTRFYEEAATKNLHLQSSDVDLKSSNRWTAIPSLALDTVSAVAGRMLIFDQSLVHEGVPPSSPFSKYIIRSDIMYTRSPGLCNQPRDLEAYAIFKDAEDLAESGMVDDAIQLFRRAFKLSPDLSKIMGHS